MIVFLSQHPFKRVLEEGPTEKIDELHSLQYLYGICVIPDPWWHRAFLITMGIWKCIQFTFGLYVSFIIYRMSFKGRIRIMIFIIVVLFIDILLYVCGPTYIPSFYYAVVSCTTILVVNVIVFQEPVIRLRIMHDLKTN